MKTEKHILDATCGSRTIWFQKEHPMAVYMDCREEHDMAIWKSTKNDSVRTLDVVPDVIADFTAMPFEDNTFELVVFDPPHLIKVGEMAAKNAMEAGITKVVLTVTVICITVELKNWLMPLAMAVLNFNQDGSTS